MGLQGISLQAHLLLHKHYTGFGFLSSNCR
jgi:hypothetical protein